MSRESAGAAIRGLREARDWSLADFASVTGVSIMGLSYLERGARRTSTEEHHPAAAPHALERVAPSLDLPGALDHQVGPEAVVEPRDLGRRIARGSIDHAVGTEPFSRLQEGF